jgi:hypothetical protein
MLVNRAASTFTSHAFVLRMFFPALASVCAVWASCARPWFRLPPDDSQYNAVWTAVLESAFPDTSFLALRDLTLDFSRAPRSPASSTRPGVFLDSATFADYLSRNRAQVPVSSYLEERARFVVLDSEPLYRIAALRGDEDWYAGLRRAYPKAQGAITLTQPGFSEDGRSAFVFVTFTCGRECGWGDAFVLRRAEKSSWRVMERRTLMAF